MIAFYAACVKTFFLFLVDSLLLFPAHLLDEDLCDISVVVESGQMQCGEAVVLFDIHQLSCSRQDLFCGPVVRTNDARLD